jgi:hypothetical protein
MTEKTQLVQQLKANGWESSAVFVLDVLEPLGPLGAQVLWVLQPALGAFVPRDVLGDLATVLEDPDETADLRRQLEAQ